MNGLGRFMEKDQQDGAWTDFHRLFDRYFLKRKTTTGPGDPEPAGPDPQDRQRALFSR
jgi:hypothetical protein